MLWRKKPDLSNLKIFGCTAFAHIEQQARSKFAPKSLRTMYLGNEPGVKGFRWYCSNPEKIIASRNVIFDEKTSFFKHEDSPASSLQIDSDENPPEVQQTPHATSPNSENTFELRRSTRPRRVPSIFDGYVQPWTISTARSSSVNPPETGNDDSPQSPSTTSMDPDPVPPTTFTAPNYTSTSESYSDTVRHSHESHSNDMVSTDQTEEYSDFLLAPTDYSVDMDTSTLLGHNLRTRDDLDDDDEVASHSSKRQRILMAMATQSTGLPVRLIKLTTPPSEMNGFKLPTRNTTHLSRIILGHYASFHPIEMPLLPMVILEEIL
ncbi:hypothetical protein LEN26_016729 [Aphanomyces euteiches]|nr:hypothetical protein LEN26_016729 [Aphanomyces euteiches]